MCMPPALTAEATNTMEKEIPKNAHTTDEQHSGAQSQNANQPPKHQISSQASRAYQNLTSVTTLASISLFLLCTSFTLTLPHLQSQRDSLDCDILCQGSLTSLRSTLGLIGATLMGRLSDSPRVGRRICLYAGSGAAFLSLILGIGVVDRAGLFWSMVPAALLQQNFSVWKAVLAEYAEELEKIGSDSDKTKTAAMRAGSVGKLGMSAGLAFMVGPLVGATVVKTYESASYVAIVMVLLSAVFITRMPVSSMEKISLQTTVTTGEKENVEKSGSDMCTTSPTTKSTLPLSSKFQFLNLASSMTSSTLYLIFIRIFMALAFHIYNTIWTASLKTRFNFGPRDHGQFMSFIGLVYALSQGYIARIILAPLSRRGRIRILQICCIVLGVGRVLAFHLTDIRLVYITFGGIIIGLGLVNTVLTADAGRLVPGSEIGGLYGILDAAQSAAGMVGPVLGGSLSRVGVGGSDGVSAPLGTVVGLYGVVFLMVTFGYERLILGTDCVSGFEGGKTIVISKATVEVGKKNT